MKKILFILISAVIASASDGTTTDIVARSINFLIFIAILWYLVGDKINKFFEDRKEKIAEQFAEVEKKLEESKKEKELLENKLEETKIKSKEMIEDAKKEANLIYEKILANVKEEIRIKEKNFEEYKKIELKKAQKEVTKEFLEDLLKDVHLSSEDAAKIVMKKVA